jgi:hypothetical protein
MGTMFFATNFGFWMTIDKNVYGITPKPCLKPFTLEIMIDILLPLLSHG